MNQRDRQRGQFDSLRDDNATYADEGIVTLEWMRWGDLPWFAHPEAGGAALQLAARWLEIWLEADTPDPMLRQQLPDISAEYSAQWVAVVERAEEWNLPAECGRRPSAELPFHFFQEALEHEAAAVMPWNDVAGWSVLAAPCGGEAANHLLILGGKNISRDQLPVALVLARTIGIILGVSAARGRDARRIARLRSTLEVASTFSAVRETEPLLELIAEKSTQLLDCDRSSIFIWDPSQRQVIACPALGVEGKTLRLPDDKGIVGKVIQTGERLQVDDAYRDERFDQSVDKASGYTTRNLLCCPLRDGQGRLIGAFEAINKNHGRFTDDDAVSLEELGVQAAVALQNLKEREQLIRSREQLAEQVKRDVNIVGQSETVAALSKNVERLAMTDLPVLILGESGTGKEVISQALHYRGSRADNPFIAVNCAAISETLLESELFGHEKGAFTDAHESRRGKFELADGGTLFLDEIGDMSLGGQAKLLRVLEQKVITRVGGSQVVPVDVRVVAATNANLTEAVREKRFREDLYYRLSVVTLEIPPLRDRPEDILPLAEYFLDRFCMQANRRRLEISPDARRRLQAHAWPGNVRELRNLMERVAFLCAGDRVEVDDLAFILSPEQETALEPSPDLGLDQATRQFQREFIRRSIKRVGGNMSEAARLLGLHRSNLYRKMRQLSMKEVGDEE